MLLATRTELPIASPRETNHGAETDGKIPKPVLLSPTALETGTLTKIAQLKSPVGMVLQRAKR